MRIIENIGNTWTRATFVIALAGLAFLTQTQTAAAQEKGAERLMRLQAQNKRANAGTARAAAAAAMCCPKCKDTWATVTQKTFKAAHPRETKVVQRHECPGCSTKIVTQGVGKLARSKVVHTCTDCGSANPAR